MAQGMDDFRKQAAEREIQWKREAAQRELEAALDKADLKAVERALANGADARGTSIVPNTGHHKHVTPSAIYANDKLDLPITWPARFLVVLYWATTFCERKQHIPDQLADKMNDIMTALVSKGARLQAAHEEQLVTDEEFERLYQAAGKEWTRELNVYPNASNRGYSPDRPYSVFRHDRDDALVTFINDDRIGNAVKFKILKTMLEHKAILPNGGYVIRKDKDVEATRQRMPRGDGSYPYDPVNTNVTYFRATPPLTYAGLTPEMAKLLLDAGAKVTKQVLETPHSAETMAFLVNSAPNTLDEDIVLGKIQNYVDKQAQANRLHKESGVKPGYSPTEQVSNIRSQAEKDIFATINQFGQITEKMYLVAADAAKEDRGYLITQLLLAQFPLVKRYETHVHISPEKIVPLSESVMIGIAGITGESDIEYTLEDICAKYPQCFAGTITSKVLRKAYFDEDCFTTASFFQRLSGQDIRMVPEDVQDVANFALKNQNAHLWNQLLADGYDLPALTLDDLKKNPDFKPVLKAGSTNIQFALASGNFAAFEEIYEMLRGGATQLDPNARHPETKEPALVTALKLKDKEKVGKLMLVGADPHLEDKNGVSAYKLAAEIAVLEGDDSFIQTIKRSMKIRQDRASSSAPGADKA